MKIGYVGEFPHGNDIQKLLRLQQSGEIKTGIGFHQILFRHDDWCPKITNSGACICDPDIEIMEAKR